jgi:hypothetical protein
VACATIPAWSQPTSTPGYDWLASGGAYWIIGIGWVANAMFFAYLAMRSGRLAGSPNDGCLLGICGVIMAFAGGGVGLYAGLLLTRYPTFVLTSLIGSTALPGFGMMLLAPRLKR